MKNNLHFKTFPPVITLITSTQCLQYVTFKLSLPNYFTKVLFLQTFATIFCTYCYICATYVYGIVNIPSNYTGNAMWAEKYDSPLLSAFSHLTTEYVQQLERGQKTVSWGEFDKVLPVNLQYPWTMTLLCASAVSCGTQIPFLTFCTFFLPITTS